MAEDPQKFLDGVYKILTYMGVTSREKSELASYKLREVAQVLYTQWKDNRSVESNLGKIARNLKRSGSNDQRQSRFKKKVSNQDGHSSPKVILEKGSGSQNGKTTCATCGEMHYGQCLLMYRGFTILLMLFP